MPRPRKPARLWLEPERRDAEGRVTHVATWVIRDGSTKRATGCGNADIAGAQRALANYLADQHAERALEPEKGKSAAQTSCADVLAYYANRASDKVKRPKEMLARIERLLAFWGDKTLADVTLHTCDLYAKSRATPSAARRELEDFKAALKLAIAQGHCREQVVVELPPKPEGRVDAFTREQVAKLVWYCWRHREIQTRHRGAETGQKKETDRFPLRHLCPFILAAVYTASRSARIWQASYHKEPGRPWMDLENGVFHRMWTGEVRTKKRAGTVRIPRRLLAHMRIWKQGPFDKKGVRQPRDFVVQWRGRPADPKKALAAAMDVVFGEGHPYVRHTLRHTSVTWLLWAGEKPEEIADYASMTVKMLHEVYGHVHPDANAAVGDAFTTGRAGKRVGRSIREHAA